jgi:hypothetical protein
MVLGNMGLRNLTGSASHGDKPVRPQSRLRERKLTSLTLILLGVGLLLGAVTGLAKDKRPQSKTVTGVVMDENENLLSGAMVEMKDLQTGKVLDSYSQEGGQYQFSDLRFDHDYTIQATYKDDSSEVRQVSSVDTRTRPVLNLTILKTNK